MGKVTPYFQYRRFGRLVEKNGQIASLHLLNCPCRSGREKVGRILKIVVDGGRRLGHPRSRQNPATTLHAFTAAIQRYALTRKTRLLAHGRLEVPRVDRASTRSSPRPINTILMAVDQHDHRHEDRVELTHHRRATAAVVQGEMLATPQQAATEVVPPVRTGCDVRPRGLACDERESPRQLSRHSRRRLPIEDTRRIDAYGDSKEFASATALFELGISQDASCATVPAFLRQLIVVF